MVNEMNDSKEKGMMRLSKIAEGWYQCVVSNNSALQFAQVVAYGPKHRRGWKVFVNASMTLDTTMTTENFRGSSLKECRDWLAAGFAAPICK